jgi:hypothetical protein
MSWKCGGPGGDDYGDGLYAFLESAPFTLPANATLTFWHWIDAEVSQAYPGYCYDGGLLEISIDGGAWEVITPAGGYPYLMRPGTNPLPEDTPVFSGSHDWRQESFDLAGYEGSARVRWAFTSDEAVTREGWYIDDVMLALPVASIGEADVTGHLQLRPATSVLTGEPATLRLDMPRAAKADVQILDVQGRLVRALVSGQLAAGQHLLTWDGRNTAGRPAGDGVYWARVQVGGLQRTARLVVVH